MFLNLKTNLFLQNFATISGGGIMLYDKIPTDLQSLNQFTQNQARYFGPDFASNPFRILFLSNQNFCDKILFLN